MDDCNCNLCAKAENGQPVPELCNHKHGTRDKGFCRDFKRKVLNPWPAIAKDLIPELAEELEKAMSKDDGATNQ